MMMTTVSNNIATFVISVATTTILLLCYSTRVTCFTNNKSESPSPSSPNSLSSIDGGINVEDEPEIVEPIPNVTVAIGREAKIPCKVRGLGKYRVAWLRVESKTILTIHHHIITRNYRIGLSHSDDRHFNLHISDVQESDRGGYMCQINTVPMKFQVGYLDVVVPPEISPETCQTDITVRENQNITLKCSASGRPRPTVRWRREDGKPIEFGNWQEKKSQGIDPPDMIEGESITIRKVSRLHMGAYLAIASNGVPPSVSKRILLNVHFPPMIWVPNQLIGAAIGTDAILTCNTEAFPVSINYWTQENENDALMPSTEKYEINIVEKSYKTFMTLRIRNVSPEDFTTYKCYARNALGTTQGSIKLYDKDSSSRGAFKDISDGMSQLQDYSSSRGNRTLSTTCLQEHRLLLIGILTVVLCLKNFAHITMMATSL